MTRMGPTNASDDGDNDDGLARTLMLSSTPPHNNEGVSVAIKNKNNRDNEGSTIIDLLSGVGIEHLVNSPVTVMDLLDCNHAAAATNNTVTNMFETHPQQPPMTIDLWEGEYEQDYITTFPAFDLLDSHASDKSTSTEFGKKIKMTQQDTVAATGSSSSSMNSMTTTVPSMNLLQRQRIVENVRFFDSADDGAVPDVAAPATSSLLGISAFRPNEEFHEEKHQLYIGVGTNMTDNDILMIQDVFATTATNEEKEAIPSENLLNSLSLTTRAATSVPANAKEGAKEKRATEKDGEQPNDLLAPPPVKKNIFQCCWAG
eukprot:CAMPEP_0202442658 /NCGR_PEP_ID=MMETSP1360-20130828/2043_1 /ASSEMBLY_ACC=CAM_ASM_000848 /TAXON_ID=515479 /ORGANISM="Licmophora paradoxa, Strain CCMP2313" /LENGTH=315 /DNA_ID=CAMNT_0049058083 /DNA_START=153 /DNA_END=1103 /DNA_ORIENTATION=-